MIRNLFDRLTPQSFKNFAIIFCLAGDLIISKFLWDRFSNREQFNEYFQMSQLMIKEAFEAQGMTLPPNLESEVFQILLQSLMLMIVLFVTFHLIIYLFYFLTKRFAFLYVRLLAWLGGFGAIAFSFSFFSVSAAWSLIFFMQFVFYLFCAIGFKYFPILPKKLQEQ